VADDYAAESRRKDHGRIQVGDACADRTAERFGVLRVLQHQRTLEIPGAVQAGRQAEVAVEQGAGFPEEIEEVVGTRHHAIWKSCECKWFAVVYNSRV
jgi:hypothetical protein